MGTIFLVTKERHDITRISRYNYNVSYNYIDVVGKGFTSTILFACYAVNRCTLS